jgi:protein pelota
MKVLNRNNRQGVFVVLVETLDDLWYLSQVVREGDMVKSKTTRRVKSKDGRVGSDERRTFTIGVKVEKIDFKEDSLRLLGVIDEGPEDYVSLGSHHSLGIELDDVLTIRKDLWFESDVLRLEEAVKSTLRPKVLIAALEDGEASFGLVLESRVKYYDLSTPVGGKYDTSSRERNKLDFYRQVLDFLQRVDGRENVRALILAGPGFEKDNFLEYLREKDVALASKAVVENTGSGGRNGITEVLKRPVLKSVLENIGSAEDVNLVNRLLEHIGRGDGLGVYGLEEIGRAVSLGAVELLLVSEKTFLSQRGPLEVLMRAVKDARGRVHIVSRAGEAGQQLEALGGVAGLLRFRIQ